MRALTRQISDYSAQKNAAGWRVIFAALLSASLGCAHVAFAESIVDVKDNTDYLGSDYKSFAPAGNDRYACVAACKSDGACKAFTYTRPGVKGPQAMCFLKNAKPAPTTNNCCISGTKTDIVGPHIIVGPEASANDGLDYPGNDYKRLLTSAPNAQECANFCRLDSGCKAYTYVKPGWQGPAGVCYLKNAIPPSTNNACCVSGVKTPDTGLKTALVRGSLPQPNWGACSDSGALDVLKILCSTNLIPGMTCQAPGPQAKCANYTRQLPVGAGVADFLIAAAPPVQSFANYADYGAARRLARRRCALCANCHRISLGRPERSANRWSPAGLDPIFSERSRSSKLLDTRISILRH